MTILVSNLLLQITLRKLPVTIQEADNMEDKSHPIRIWIGVPSILGLILAGFWLVSKDTVAQTIFMTLVFAVVQNLVIPLYYILRIPKLKKFTLKQWPVLPVLQLFKSKVSPVID